MSPRRNRVTPYGAFEAVSERGSIMGNRGCLHDEAGEIGSRPFARRPWLICQLEFRGRRRPLNEPGCYTQLFGLDEATMLAAGHRPCALCRRSAFSAFRDAWCRVHSLSSVSAETIDAELHAARIDAGRQITYRADLGTLPDGTMIGMSGSPALVWGGSLHPWRHSGYGDCETVEPGRIVTVLTPRPTVRVLAAGYRPLIALSRPPAAISVRKVPGTRPTPMRLHEPPTA